MCKSTPFVGEEHAFVEAVVEEVRNDRRPCGRLAKRMFSNSPRGPVLLMPVSTRESGLRAPNPMCHKVGKE